MKKDSPPQNSLVEAAADNPYIKILRKAPAARRLAEPPKEKQKDKGRIIYVRGKPNRYQAPLTFDQRQELAEKEAEYQRYDRRQESAKKSRRLRFIKTLESQKEKRMHTMQL